ncbi:hypothetical protein CEP52_013896 [Fusarium oligoseptatum]|uniref:CENP-V/GFA domain-containing protein n=1 Tax=Fusarium oligoseptatum TaxID=2604345 RepID=A0A428SR95_9HYPO|nr:hypothetical protein CEP52_013896 [Fusarium oligoseptatum]
MALPDEANTVTGGCSCGAIRYRIAIPRLEDRPLHPMAPPSSNTRLPQAITCHCNDCRRSTGAFLSPAMVDIPAPMLTVSSISPSSESTIPMRIVPLTSQAQKSFLAGEESKTWIRFYHSTTCGKALSRSFCGRCGTPICFHFKLIPEYCHEGNMPKDFEDLFHIYLGTVDREFLDKELFIPDMEVNFKFGITFGKTVSATAKGLKEIPKVQEFDGEVSKEELQKLAA